MRHRARLVPLALLLIAIVAGTVWWATTLGEEEEGLSASGTVEAVQVAVGSDTGGRVVAVHVRAGDRVEQDQPLVQLDTELLEGQLAQAQAGLQAAEAGYDLLAAGPSLAQQAAAAAAVRRAEASLASLEDQLEAARDKEVEMTNQVMTTTAQIGAAEAALAQAQSQAAALPKGAPTDQSDAVRSAVAQAQAMLQPLTPQLALTRQLQAAAAAQVWLLESQLAVAEAALDSSRAQRDLMLEGARPEQLAVARAQVDAARAAAALLQVRIDRQTLGAPVTGTVLSRNVEPGETVLPGAPLVTLGILDDLTITVYVPEDRYGEIRLGQAATLTVDSFPGQTFAATVRQISDQAEFTPRNVQTARGRSATVFAIELTIADGSGKLRPGMPADVRFAEGG